MRYAERPAELEDLFLAEAKRRVNKDRTVSLDGRIYEVDAVLVGETVTLRFDPSRPSRDVQVWSDGQRAKDAKLVDTRANCFVKRERTLQMSKLAGDGDDEKGGV